MFQLKLMIVVVICCVFGCRCDFSDIVNINEIIENSTILPKFDDQVASGNSIKPDLPIQQDPLQYFYENSNSEKLKIILIF